MCVCLCLCSTHLVLAQLNGKLDILYMYAYGPIIVFAPEFIWWYNCSVAKLEHFLANHFVYMYVKLAILRTLYTMLGISRILYEHV